jgi:hypothetical protein
MTKETMLVIPPDIGRLLVGGERRMPLGTQRAGQEAGSIPTSWMVQKARSQQGGPHGP